MHCELRRTVCGWVAAVLLAWASRAWGWGPDGHVIVARIAQARLTPTARAEMQRLLGRLEFASPEVVMWPDEIRGSQRYEKKYPRNASWHFVDFDVMGPSPEPHSLDGDDNVVAQVTRWHNFLLRKRASKERRLDALRFLAHFMADLHQPLHCAYRYYDMGGNMIPVHSFHGEYFTVTPDTPMDRLPNLHIVWDEYLVSELLAGKSPAEIADELNEGISEDQRQEWLKGSPKEWALESHEIARERVYRWANNHHLPFKWRRPGMELTMENYISLSLPYVRLQLQRAGVRLAHYLNWAFDPAYRQQQ